jgi:hypothetical protein
MGGDAGHDNESGTAFFQDSDALQKQGKGALAFVENGIGPRRDLRIAPGENRDVFLVAGRFCVLDEKSKKISRRFRPHPTEYADRPHDLINPLIFSSGSS